MSSVIKIYFFANLTILTTAACATAQSNFRITNPSFEEDYDQDGIPEGWHIPAGSDTQITRRHTSHGARAVRCASGYEALTFEQKLRTSYDRSSTIAQT